MQQLLGEIDFAAFFDEETIRSLLESFVIFLIGFLVLRIVVFILRRLLRRQTPSQIALVIPRIVNYAGLAILISVVLLQAGVNLTPILGAAGVVGIAVGIAGQASLSNMISGFLLASEKTFAVGDVIRTGTTTGIVDSMDLLSTKLRTFDNLYVRVPNEKLATAEITNITRFPIRRLDITLTVPFFTSLTELFEILKGVASNHRLVLEEPEPLILPLDYTEMGCKVLLGVWFSKPDFLTVKADMFAAIATAFSENGIEFAVPPRSIVNAAAPFTVTLAGDSALEASQSESEP